MDCFELTWTSWGVLTETDLRLLSPRFMIVSSWNVEVECGLGLNVHDARNSTVEEIHICYGR